VQQCSAVQRDAAPAAQDGTGIETRRAEPARLQEPLRDSTGDRSTKTWQTKPGKPDPANAVIGDLLHAGLSIANRVVAHHLMVMAPQVIVIRRSTEET